MIVRALAGVESLQGKPGFNGSRVSDLEVPKPIHFSVMRRKDVSSNAHPACYCRAIIGELGPGSHLFPWKR